MNKEQGKNSGQEGNPYPLDRYTTQPQNSATEQKNESPYFKSQAPSITLPKGGGALKGIDEKFTVNAVNGTAGLEVALPLTPGRNGFTPSLSLSYNSGSGNSEFGLGWGLSLPSIQRKTDKQLPRYDDANESDVFLLAGAEDLVRELDIQGEPVTITNGAYTIRCYRPRIEELFARIEYIQETGNPKGWWKVTTKDNITTFYGLTEEGRISDPANDKRIFKWLPQLVTDHKGNMQYYTYKQEDFDGVASFPDQVELYPHERNHLNYQEPCNNVYLKSVYYTNDFPIYITPTDVNEVYKPSLPGSPESAFLMQLVLDYGEHDNADPQPEDTGLWDCRKDPFSDFHAGFEIRMWRKCRRILMFHHFQELRQDGACLVRSLDMTYHHDETEDSFTETDYITAFTQKGYKYVETTNSYHVKALPSMILEYQALQWNNTIEDVAPGDIANAPQGLTGNYQWIDLYGEGLPGILTEQGTGLFYKQNLGDGHFTPALAVGPKPSLQGLGNALQWQDLDADGKRQLVSNDSSLPGYYELRDVPSTSSGNNLTGNNSTGSGSTVNLAPGTQEWQPFQPFKSRVNIDWNSPYTKMLDLTGDGKPDLLITDSHVWTWYENLGKEGYAEGSRVTTVWDEEKGPRLLLQDEVQSIFLADMNGDGLTDLVRIKNGEICYWANKGYGKFSAKITMTNAPRFDHPDNFNPLYITLADISGTGAADILYLGKNNCTAWINLAGNAWSLPYYIHPLPSVEPYSKIGVMDFLGNDTGCIVWSSPLPQHAHAPLRYIDLMGGKKPHLLKSYKNGMGKKTELCYKSSTQFYLQDKQAATPWATRLPFPVHCLSRIVTTDAVSETSYTQVYRYHHGYYDHEEREFRGFGMVEVKDIESAKFYYEDENDSELDQPEVLTKTWYHTGAWMREQTLLDAFGNEYYDLGSAVAQLTSSDILSLPSGLTPQEQREAHRAVKGLPLRQEVYALDGELEEHPYTVTSYAYRVNLLQSQAINRYAVFYAYREQATSYHCERYLTDSPTPALDPRIAQEFTLAVDEYGNVTDAAQVVYPRIGSSETGNPIIDDQQAAMKITYNHTEHTNDVISDVPAGSIRYRLRIPCSQSVYELQGVANLLSPGTLWTAADLMDAYASCSVIDFTEDYDPLYAEKKLLSETHTIYYDNIADQPLALGTLEALSMPYQQYTAAFTEKMLNTTLPTTVYNGRVTAAMLGTEGGYIQLSSNILFPDHTSDTRWWLPSGITEYDAAMFFLATTYFDPWGADTQVDYDSYHLLPVNVTDALGNETTIEAIDWRCLQPTRIKDINANYSDILYDTLCMPVAMAMKGKDNGLEGDELDHLDSEDILDVTAQAAFWIDPKTEAAGLLKGATWRCIYDFNVAENEPVRVAMIAREKHFVEAAAGPMLLRFTYTDGFGRVAMHKAQCAPKIINGSAHSWVGSGKTVYNNKGKTVLQYEPYFSTTHEYDPAQQAAEKGVSPRMYYDPLGRLYKTVMPDKSITETEWTPWIQVSYDGNDTVFDSGWLDDRVGSGIYAGIPEEVDAKNKTLAHADTPTIMHLDTLARPFYTIQTLTSAEPVEALHSYVELDIQGNRLAVHDARGFTPLQYRYNLLKAPCKTISIDSGTQLILSDAAGQPLYSWDTDDREFRFVYDVLRRPIEKYVDTALLETMTYGEGELTPEADNLRGQLFETKDGAGLVTIERYDFKGNPLKTIRKFTVDATAHPDWSASVTLETTGYTSEIVYDAMNRPVSLKNPDNSLTLHCYDAGGMLYSVAIDNVHALDTDIVNAIEYDAKGQRTKIQYENGTTTTYEYDTFTFRVRRIRTTRASDTAVLQDLLYWYDPVGNITKMRDEAQQTIYYNNSIAKPENGYTYDALYRLIEASGREHEGNGSAPDADSWNDVHRMQLAHKHDETKMRPYTQYYEYDEVGNMTRQRHTTTNSTYNWTKDFTIAGNSNQLTGVTNLFIQNYTYDNRGNLIAGMAHLNAGGTSMSYNDLNRLETVVLDANRTAYYQYDSEGQRVRKTIVNTSANTMNTRKYVGSWEVYEAKSGSTVTLQRETLHISDDTGRIALIDAPTVDTLSTGEVQLLRYQYSNQLSTATLELDDTGAIISYEEYYPYGSTSFQSGRTSAEVSRKRYRYTGKERDDETGLYYHGARYYMPWLCRWCAVDPLESKYARWSSYNYGFCNPIIFNDPSGESPEDDGVKISEQGQVRLVEMAKSSPQYKDAVKRGDKVVLEQYFHIWQNEGVAQSQQELNVGEEDANVFYISQSGYLDIDAQPRHPGGRFEMSFDSKAKFPLPEAKPVQEEQIKELPQPTPTTEPKENIPITVEITKQEIVGKKVEVVKKEAVAKNYSDIPGWATFTGRMTSELYSFTYNVVNFYKKTDATELNVTFNLPPNIMSGANQKDLSGLAGWSAKHGRYSNLSSVQKAYKTDKTHIQNIEGQIKEFGNILRELLPGMKINVHTNKKGTNSSILVQPVRPQRR